MNIKVCDALCGSGKTSACIRMMNERTESRFIFVTQFLSEVDRIKTKCSARQFVSPENDGRTKLSDIKELLQNGVNIATTHALFLSSTEEIKALLRKQHYILVLDETVDVLQMSDLKPCDMNLLLRSNVVTEGEDGNLHWNDETYERENFDGEGMFSQEVLLAKSKNLLRYQEEYFFWMLPPDLFGSFAEVYILTYMFYSQPLKCFFDMNRFDYELVGVRRNGNDYEFCDVNEMDRRRDLRDKIHILEHKKLNEIGESRTALSYSALSTSLNGNGVLLNQLRKNLSNAFRNVFKASSDKIMWTVFKDCKDAIADKGFTHSFVPYNKRASNEYADKRYLAYCVNNFMRPWESQYYRERGVDVNQDAYALSIIVQWVFRSAIRNDKEIWIYVPSARMRCLLADWLQKLADGNDLEPVEYKVRYKGHQCHAERVKKQKRKVLKNE